VCSAEPPHSSTLTRWPQRRWFNITVRYGERHRPVPLLGRNTCLQRSRVVGHALCDARSKLWLLAGLLAGLGLNNKTAVVVLLFAILIGVLLVPSTRKELGSGRPSSRRSESLTRKRSAGLLEQ
jgi:hypothetical protein